MAKRCSGGVCEPVEIAPAVVESPQAIALKVAVGRSVLRKLGTPKDLYSVVAVNVYGNHWRVNVRRTVAEGFVKQVSITDSFFVKADSQGNVLDEIASKY